ncbi:MAG: glycyl-tRNA synthetase, partial [Candidatus Woesearchaeota archaeon]
QLNIPGDGLSAKKINELVQENSLICTICKSPFEEVTDFNLMFTTQVGPTGETTAFLRPETAQMIFSQFKLISDSARGKLPFGVGQIGKAFRNEISPRNFLFRLRELEQMELEYFTHPDKPSETVSEIENEEVLVFTKFAQANNEHQKKMTIKQLLADKIITNTHLAYFLGKGLQFLSSVGLRRENLRIRQHLDDELAHYSDDCWDIEYKFPFGFKEMWGFADRGTFDLDAHAKASGKEMFLMDDATGKKINPRVVEPAIGLDRLFLAMMFDALSYSEERKNHVLSLSAKIAPIQVGILPLLKKDGLRELGQEVYDSLKDTFRCFYDESGSIGKRYYRLDETGCPFCVTIDYDTKEKGTVTIRNRDSGEQEIVALTELKAKLQTII